MFKKWKINDDLVSELILAIDEACTNAIQHGHQCNKDKNIELIIKKEGHLLTVLINDIGQITDNLNYHLNKPVSDLVKEKKKGGLGLKIIHKVMDNVQYKLKNGKYSCLMVKNI